MKNVTVWGLYNENDKVWLRRNYVPEYSLEEDDPKLLAAARNCGCIQVKEMPLEFVVRYDLVADAVERFLRIKKLDQELG